MTSSYAALRAKQGNVLEKAQQKLAEEKKKSSGGQIDDETYLDISHVRNADGIGYIRGRFLPAPQGEDDNYVRYFEYAFEGPGGWYIQKGRNTLGKNEQDPVYEYNGKIFADKTLTKEDRQKRLLGRREYFVSNFLVLKDPNKPENDGKIFRYKFGPQIFGKIEGALFPKKSENLGDDEAEVVAAFDPFDPFEGRDFILRVTTKDIKGKPVPSYETSGFAKNITSIVDDPADFDAIWEKEYPLAELVAPAAFKSYEELVKEFKRAMGTYEELVKEYKRAMGTEAKSFLDTDEPLTKAEPKQAEKRAAKEQVKALEEEIDDEIPDFSKKAADTEKASEDSGDDADWFNDLRK